MPEAGYNIETDPARKRVHIRMFGHWTSDLAISFANDLRTKVIAMRSSGGRPGEYLTIIDALDYIVQAQGIAEIFATLAADPEIMSRKIAVIIPTGLAKLQAKRLLFKDNHRIFESAAEAQRWLYRE